MALLGAVPAQSSQRYRPKQRLRSAFAPGVAAASGYKQQRGAVVVNVLHLMRARLLDLDLSSDAADPRAGCCSAQRKQLSRPACRPCGAASRGGGLLLTEQKQSLADSRLTSVD
jgi:hypothetical protein